MSMSRNKHEKRVFKIVLTGGPCGGKTTGQDRLAEFFESIGWKVYRVPETATILQKGGVNFPELTDADAWNFQESIVLTMLQIEETFFRLADNCRRDCLVICDRGSMDPAAYMDEPGWHRILAKNGFNLVDLRDNRYHQVIHLTTAADGAVEFYTKANNVTRTESVEKAIAVDRATQKVWNGHPYFDVVTNTGMATFEDKILKLIQIVCSRTDVEAGDRLAKGSRKRKWLVFGLRDDAVFPPYQEFEVVHNYLHSTDDPEEQSRIRKRGQGGKFCYSYTTRRHIAGTSVDTRVQITSRDYELLWAHRDLHRAAMVKKRRTFLWRNRYFQLDIYQEPLPPSAPQLGRPLMILETYTTVREPWNEDQFPECLLIDKEITGVGEYSMYNMALRVDAVPEAGGANGAFAAPNGDSLSPKDILKKGNEEKVATNGNENGV